MLPERFPPLYPITDANRSGLSHSGLVRIFIEAGVGIVQLRDKRAGREFFEEVRRSVFLSRGSGMSLLVNDRVDMALAAGADGVHLGEEDLPILEARKILGSGRVIGSSTHSVEEAIRAAAKDVDYIAIGPIFKTETKTLSYAPLGPGAIAQVRRSVQKPIVAIGGITLERVPDVFEAGADSVAVISDLLCRGDIRTRVREYLSVIEIISSK